MVEDNLISCSSCKAKISGSVKFCPECGGKLAPQAGAPIANDIDPGFVPDSMKMMGAGPKLPPSAPQGAPNRRTAVLVIICIVLAVLGALVTIPNYLEKREAEAKKRQLIEYDFRTRLERCRARLDSGEGIPSDSSVSIFTSDRYRELLIQEFPGRAESIREAASRYLARFWELQKLHRDEEIIARKKWQAAKNKHSKIQSMVDLDSVLCGFIRQFDDVRNTSIWEAADMIKTERIIILVPHKRDFKPHENLRKKIYVESLGRKPVVMKKSNAFRTWETTEYFEHYRFRGIADRSQAQLVQDLADAKTEERNAYGALDSFAVRLIEDMSEHTQRLRDTISGQ